MIFSFWHLLFVILFSCFTNKLNVISFAVVSCHKQRLGFVKKLDICIPHELIEIHLTKRTNACDLHLKRNEFDVLTVSNVH